MYIDTPLRCQATLAVRSSQPGSNLGSMLATQTRHAAANPLTMLGYWPDQ